MPSTAEATIGLPPSRKAVHDVFHWSVSPRGVDSTYNTQEQYTRWQADFLGNVGSPHGMRNEVERASPPGVLTTDASALGLAVAPGISTGPPPDHFPDAQRSSPPRHHTPPPAGALLGMILAKGLHMAAFYVSILILEC